MIEDGAKLLDNILRTLLLSKGFDVKEKVLLYKYKLSNDLECGIDRIIDINELIETFGDGNYYLQCFETKISGIDPHPFTIPFMFISANYKNNKCEVTFHADEEEIWTEGADIAYLENRKNKLNNVLTQSFEMLPTIVSRFKNDYNKNTK
jgi:hypothetical protein